MGFAVTTAAQGQTAVNCWRKAGGAVTPYRADIGDTTPLNSLPLGADCPYGNYAADLYDRVEAGASTFFDVTMTLNGDLDTAWRSAGAPPQGYEETGVPVPKVIHALRDGIERYFITDVNAPAASNMAQSTLFVMMDNFAPKAGFDNESAPTETAELKMNAVLISNHVPGGSNVLYMDGHVEWIKWTPPAGSTFPLKIHDVNSPIIADGKNWLLDFTVGTADGSF